MSSRGQILPLEQRIQLHREVLKLREQGLSYNRIIERIHRHNRIRLSKSRISIWVNRLQSPLGNVNKFNAKPSPELAYIVGVRLGDGYLYKHGDVYEFILNTVDYDFAAETGRCLAKLLTRKKPYQPRWDKWKPRWRVTSYSILLYQLLKGSWHNLRPYIEYCRDYVAAFLRGLFDSEGSITRTTLTIHNTNKELLLYVQHLLHQYFGIGSTGPHKGPQAGHWFRDSDNGKMYQTKKQCYYLYIPVRDLPRFNRYIAFTIKRKQQRLIETVQK